MLVNVDKVLKFLIKVKSISKTHFIITKNRLVVARGGNVQWAK